MLYILGSMYIDLPHTGDEPCECTGCDKGFINELYKFVDTRIVIYLIGRSDDPNIGLGKTIEVPYVGQAFDVSEI